MKSGIKHRVMIVDDSRPLREGLSLLLCSDYEIASAESGEEAIEKLDKFDPDLMLLDLKLPGLDGEEILRQVSRERPNMRVMVITATRGTEARHLFRLGARDYLQKPFGIGYLKQRLEEVLRD